MITKSAFVNNVKTQTLRKKNTIIKPMILITFKAK